MTIFYHREFVPNSKENGFDSMQPPSLHPPPPPPPMQLLLLPFYKKVFNC